ncbi:MAG: class I SAM-dependent methyltransferase, partial [Solirubrobacterales bacterium]|nr:class I SAM-dependent methyltransferase [Solirubrobacterales bacterium]
MEARRTAEEIRDVNARYHDSAARSYDWKWGIDFGETGQAQVRRKLRKIVGPELDLGYQRALEVGAGTGYFGLNLLQSGVVREVTCTDISTGMIARLGANAERLGLQVKTARAEAESLPFASGSFDFVLGHAVLHHLPDLERAFAEFYRVLEPGGRMVFAGEPSRLGDRLAGIPKRGAVAVAPLWRAMMRAAASASSLADARSTPTIQDDRHLERLVDVHSFVPGELSALAQRAGFGEVRVRGEELIANWFG